MALLPKIITLGAMIWTGTFWGTQTFGPKHFGGYYFGGSELLIKGQITEVKSHKMFGTLESRAEVLQSGRQQLRLYNRAPCQK